MDIARITTLTSAFQARIWLAQDHLKEAQAWAEEYQQVGPTEYLREYEDLTLAWVFMARGKVSEGLALLDVLLGPAQEAGRTGRLIEIQAQRALAFHALQNKEEALTALKHALNLGSEEGYVRAFVDRGQPMTDCLTATANRDVNRGYLALPEAAFQ
jgi:LuxR family maltose regulon positive regulatory protein